jgi:hypothetical protein
MQFAIQIIKPSGLRELLKDNSGVLGFTTRKHAERMTERLAACGSSDDVYEVVEQPN